MPAPKIQTYPDVSKRRRWPWLAAAVVLLAGAGWLMSRGDPPAHEAQVDKVNFPQRMSYEDRQRMEKRRTLAPVVVQALNQAATEAPPPRRRDPVLVALPSGKGKTAVVFEANALRNSPVGELLVDCMRRRNGQDDPFKQLRKESGIDPLTDVDRVAITSDGAMISGNFQGAKWDEVFKNSSSVTSYGDSARIFTPPLDPSGNTREEGIGAVAVWNNQMIISGHNPDEVKKIIDRLEGRAPEEPPALSEQDTYGEVYGVLSPKDLGALLGPDQKQLVEKLQEAADQVKVHVDATGDVAMVADLTGPDGEKVTDLGKTLGGVLSLARLKAQTENDHDLSDLLDLAKVEPQGDSFRAELALPMAMLEKRLAFCREKNDAGSPQP